MSIFERNLIDKVVRLVNTYDGTEFVGVCDGVGVHNARGEFVCINGHSKPFFTQHFIVLVD